MSRGRLEAFSDGVFAVAITLLALNLAVKGPGYGTLAHQLAQPVARLSRVPDQLLHDRHHLGEPPHAGGQRRGRHPDAAVPEPGAADVRRADPGRDRNGGRLPRGRRLRRQARRRRVRDRAHGDVGSASAASRNGRWERGGRGYPCRRTGGGRPGIRFMSGGLVYLVVIGIAFLSAPVALGLSGLVGVYYIFERTPAVSAAGDADADGRPGRLASRRCRQRCPRRGKRAPRPAANPERGDAGHRDDRGERRDGADDREQPGHRHPERVPAAGQAVDQPGRGSGLRLRFHRGLRADDRERNRGVGRLMVQRVLLRLHGLQVGLLRVDLVLHAEQVTDAPGARQQRAQLGDRRLVGSDPAADVRDLLGHVLRLLGEGKPRAERVPRQLAERGRVDRHRDLQRDGRQGLAGLRRVAAGVLRRDVAADGRRDGRRLRDRVVDVAGADGELRRVDELLAGWREPGGRGVLPRAGGPGRALAAGRRGDWRAAAMAGEAMAPLAAWPSRAPSAGADEADEEALPPEQPASAAIEISASPAGSATSGSRRRRGAATAAVRVFRMPLGRRPAPGRLRRQITIRDTWPRRPC